MDGMESPTDAASAPPTSPAPAEVKAILESQTTEVTSPEKQPEEPNVQEDVKSGGTSLASESPEQTKAEPKPRKLPPFVKELTETELETQLARLKEEVGKIIAVENAEWKNVRYSDVRDHFEGCKRICQSMNRVTLMYFETAANAVAALAKWKEEDGYGDLKPDAIYMLSEKRSFNNLPVMQIDKQILQLMGIPMGVSWKSLKPCFPGAVKILINRDMIKHGMAQVVYNSEENAADIFKKGTIEIEDGNLVTVVYSPYRAFVNERFLFKDAADSMENPLDPRISFNPPRRYWRRRNNGGNQQHSMNNRGDGAYNDRREGGGSRGRRRGNYGYRQRRRSSSGGGGERTRIDSAASGGSQQDAATETNKPRNRYGSMKKEFQDLKSDLDLLRSTVGTLAKALKISAD